MQTNYLATLRANSLRANAFNRLAASRRCASMLSVIKTLLNEHTHTARWNGNEIVLLRSKRRWRRAVRRASLRRADDSLNYNNNNTSNDYTKQY